MNQELLKVVDLYMAIDIVMLATKRTTWGALDNAPLNTTECHDVPQMYFRFSTTPNKRMYARRVQTDVARYMNNVMVHFMACTTNVPIQPEPKRCVARGVTRCVARSVAHTNQSCSAFPARNAYKYEPFGRKHFISTLQVVSSGCPLSFKMEQDLIGDFGAMSIEGVNQPQPSTSSAADSVSMSTDSDVNDSKRRRLSTSIDYNRSVSSDNITASEEETNRRKKKILKPTKFKRRPQGISALTPGELEQILAIKAAQEQRRDVLRKQYLGGYDENSGISWYEHFQRSKEAYFTALAEEDLIQTQDNVSYIHKITQNLQRNYFFSFFFLYYSYTTPVAVANIPRQLHHSSRIQRTPKASKRRRQQRANRNQCKSTFTHTTTIDHYTICHQYEMFIRLNIQQ